MVALVLLVLVAVVALALVWPLVARAFAYVETNGIQGAVTEIQTLLKGLWAGSSGATSE